MSIKVEMWTLIFCLTVCIINLLFLWRSARQFKFFDTIFRFGNTIYFYAGIREETANKFVRLLADLHYDIAKRDGLDKEEITVKIKSNGGTVKESVAMKEAMQACYCKVNTLAVGKCYSGGTVALLGGKSRRAIRGTQFMIHGPQTTLSSTFGVSTMYSHYKESSSTLEMLTKMYIKETKMASEAEDEKKTFEELYKFLLEDQYLTDEEALTIGLIDEII